MISMNKIKVAARRFIEATKKARMCAPKVQINTVLLGHAPRTC